MYFVIYSLKKKTHKRQKKMTTTTTLSTCWYNLNLKKFDTSTYSQWISAFLSNVNTNFYLVIYSDQQSHHLLLPYIANNPHIKLVLIEIDQLFMARYKDFWQKNHDSNHLLNQMVDWQLNLIWAEKTKFVENTLRAAYFPPTDFYGWCDIGYFRDGSCPTHDFPYVQHLDKNKIYYACVNPNIQSIYNLVNHKNHHTRLPVEPIPPNQNTIAGGFYICGRDLVCNWADIFHHKLLTYIKHGALVKDDQIIIVDCIFSRENNRLFHIIFFQSDNQNQIQSTNQNQIQSANQNQIQSANQNQIQSNNDQSANQNQSNNDEKNKWFYFRDYLRRQKGGKEPIEGSVGLEGGTSIELLPVGVSVLMAIKNGVEYIDESVGSVLAQTYPHWELLIGINGLPVGSDIYHRAKQFYNEKIRVFDTNIQTGKSATLNYLVSQCRFRYVAILDVDDIWLPSKLAKQMATLSSFDVAGTMCEYICTENPLLHGKKPELPVGDDYQREFDFCRFNPIINSSVIIKRELAWWDETSTVEDYELWLRLRKQGRRFLNLPHVLVKHRIHSSSAFNNNLSNWFERDSLQAKYRPTSLIFN